MNSCVQRSLFWASFKEERAELLLLSMLDAEETDADVVDCAEETDEAFEEDEPPCHSRLHVS